MNGRGEHVRHMVSLVLELWDDFTDRPISDPSIVITASGLIRPLRKEDGFYVFLAPESLCPDTDDPRGSG